MKADDKCCGATSSMGFICTNDPAHKGDHVAYDAEINVTWDRWKNNRNHVE